jgi:hypothetical protein
LTEKPSKTPYLHVRPPKRVVGVGGEGEPLAKIYANRAGLLQLRDQIDATLAAEEGKLRWPPTAKPTSVASTSS